MKQKVTIKTIARDLGVSVSTVSKALKDSHEIGKSTKKRVQEYARVHNYSPNKMALRLRGTNTQIIGIILPKAVHYFFSTIISGIDYIANKRGYNIMLCFSNESKQEEIEVVKMLSDRVDGIITSIATETFIDNDFRHFEELIQNEIPIVTVDRIIPNINCDKVIIDDKLAGYQATQHLLDLGCTKIASITTPEKVTVGQLREEGFEEALKERGLELAAQQVLHVQEEEDAYQQIKEFFRQEFDGIFAVNEEYAALAIRVAKENGLQIPQDVAVLGFTDGLISEYASPSITAVDQYGFSMGEKAAQILIDRIEGKLKTAPSTTIVASKLKIRESTGKQLR